MNKRLKLLSGTVLAITFMLTLPGSLVAEDEYSARGADNCLMCHRAGQWDIMDIFHTKHGSQVDPDAPFTNEQCEACHGPSNAHVRAKNKAEVQPKVVFGGKNPSPAEEQNAMCLSCHTSTTGMGWHGSAHDATEVSCASCHESHRKRDPMFDPLEQQQICFDCHQRQRSDVFKPHGHPLRFGNMDCAGCHNVHDGNNDFLLTQDNVNDTCYTCHAEKRGPFLWEHAPVTEDCTLCHDVHGSNHPAALTRRPPLLCQTCHSAAGHPGDAYTSEDIEQRPSDRFLLSRSCMNCHSQVHGSNHPSGSSQMR